MTDKKTPQAKVEELADQELDQAQGGGSKSAGNSASDALIIINNHGAGKYPRNPGKFDLGDDFAP